MTQKDKPLVLAIVGATASGKTGLSLEVARLLNCEILCMDSMQVYRRMNIGTAKPTAQERALVPHHLLDLVEPTASFSVAAYVDAARKKIDEVRGRGHIPLLVGGTGLYLQGLCKPMDYGGLPSDAALRTALNEELDTYGNLAMYTRLAAIDPETAARLHPNDTRRVIRALEIYQLTGQPMSAHRAAEAAQSPYDLRTFAIDWPRPQLHARINRRVEQMMEEGLYQEVRSLLDSGVTADMQSMQGLGYKELIPVLTAGASLQEAMERIKTGTRNYARRQLIWFRRDKNIRWLPSEQLDSAAKTIVHSLEE